MNTEIAEKIKNMLVENLRIPADELEYTSEPVRRRYRT